MDKETIKTIREMHNKGISKTEIAQRCNITIHSVNYYNSSKYDDILIRQTAKEQSEKEFENTVIKILPDCNSLNHICSKLGLRGVEGYYVKIKKIIEKYNLDISHFGTIPPKSKMDSYNVLNDEDYFIKGIKKHNIHTIKRLINHSLKEYRCENPECGITEWNDKPITLQLHHINGDNKDNRLENLQLLCPNCHSQTENYGKHKNNVKRKDEKFLITEKIKENLKKISEYRPSKKMDVKEILEAFAQTKSFVGAGKLLNISDNGLRKKAKKLGIFDKLLEMKKN